jgi:hypothetical protein
MTQANYTQAQIDTIVAEAREAAYQAADRFFQEKLGGRDQYACGFAWVEIFGIKGNTRIGKMLKAAGLRKDFSRTFTLWNPSGYGCQNVETLEAGAYAAAEVFERHGFQAYAASRLD